MKTKSKNAYDIARAALEACVTESGFAAGMHHFVDLWARDSLFATFGANTSGLIADSKKTIQTFLSSQRHDGLIPYLILRSRHTIGKYFHSHSYYKKPVPHFRSHMSFGTVPDGGLMTVIAAASYMDASGDRAFLQQSYKKLHDALSWYSHRFKDGLIREWYQCEWADALLKSGNTLYTNVLYFRALRDMARIARKLKKTGDAQQFERHAEGIRRQIHGVLWNGEYFADWKDWKRQDYFATHPNMLAVIFGLATKSQAVSILAKAKKDAWNGWTLVNSVPEYPIWRVPAIHIFLGLKEYHNGFIWLQPGILYAMAQYVTGFKSDAKKTLSGIGKKIIEWNGAYEVYERNSTPVRRIIYTSEHPFAWSAGLFVWAWDIMR